MKPVKNAVRNRSKNYTSHQNNRQTAVESIDACKELSSIGDRRINRSHAAQKHRCVEECVNPAQSLEGVVSEHADEQGNGNNSNRNDTTVGQPHQELVRRNDTLSLVLKLWN